jgi:hypothetical protein
MYRSASRSQEVNISALQKSLRSIPEAFLFVLRMPFRKEQPGSWLGLMRLQRPAGFEPDYGHDYSVSHSNRINAPTFFNPSG